MKKTLLTLAAAAILCSQTATAQAVRNIYTEAQKLNVEKVMDGEQTVQLNRYFMAGYNTLCLPLSLDASQLAAAAKDLRVERMVAIAQEGSTLCLYFTDCTAEGIEAGVPYLVFSPTAQYMRVKNTEATLASDDLQTIRMTDGQGNQVAFSSSWNLRTQEGLYGIPAKQNTAVLESVLISTTADQSFLPTRCGFSWEQQSASANGLKIRHITASEATAISSVKTAGNIGSDAAYDLNGRRITSTAKKGIVIQGGKKIVK